MSTKPASAYSRAAALLFCLFAGFIGAHRFYVRRFWSGLFMLITMGWLLFGVVLDLVFIVRGVFNDRAGQPLTQWRTPRDKRALVISCGSIVVTLMIGPAVLAVVLGMFGLVRQQVYPVSPEVQDVQEQVEVVGPTPTTVFQPPDLPLQPRAH